MMMKHDDGSARSFPFFFKKKTFRENRALPSSYICSRRLAAVSCFMAFLQPFELHTTIKNIHQRGGVETMKTMNAAAAEAMNVDPLPCVPST